jgi:hypothetical protein
MVASCQIARKISRKRTASHPSRYATTANVITPKLNKNACNSLRRNGRVVSCHPPIETTDGRFKTELGLEPPRRFFLYVDQGEELYSRVPKDRIKSFSDLVAHGLSHPSLVVVTSQRSDYYGQLQANEALFPLSERIDVPPLGAEALKTVSPIVSLFTELTAATALVSNFSASAGDGHCNPKDRETSLNRRDQAPTMPHRRHFDVRRRKKEPAKDSWTNQVVALAIQNVWLGLASRQNHYTQCTSESAIPPVP